MLKIKLSAKASYISPIIGVVIGIAIIGIALLGGEPKTKTNKVDAPQTACGPYRSDVVFTIAGQKFNVEVAKTEAEFSKGLAGRPCILPNQAMLFAFAKQGQYKFWMKGMNFPIDIIWINSAHRVAALEIDVQPSTYHSSNPFFENDTQHLAQYVLEIKANRSKELNLSLSSPITF